MAKSQAKSGRTHQLRVGNSTDGASVSYTAVSEGKMVTLPRKLKALDATHTDSPNGENESVGGNITNGPVQWKGNALADTVQKAIRTDMDNRTKRDWTVFSPTQTNETYSFTAIVTDFSIALDKENVVELTIELTPCGVTTVA